MASERSAWTAVVVVVAALLVTDAHAQEYERLLAKSAKQKTRYGNIECDAPLGCEDVETNVLQRAYVGDRAATFSFPKFSGSEEGATQSYSAVTGRNRFDSSPERILRDEFVGGVAEIRVTPDRTDPILSERHVLGGIAGGIHVPDHRSGMIGGDDVFTNPNKTDITAVPVPGSVSDSDLGGAIVAGASRGRTPRVDTRAVVRIDDGQGNLVCSGSFLRDSAGASFLVTAAHCMYDFVGSAGERRFGSKRKRLFIAGDAVPLADARIGKGIARCASEGLTYAECTARSGSVDVATVQLPQRAVDRLKLKPWASGAACGSTRLRAMGFGRNEGGEIGHLLSGEFRRGPRAGKCARLLSPERDQIASYGDSGGPVMSETDYQQRNVGTPSVCGVIGGVVDSTGQLLVEVVVAGETHMRIEDLACALDAFVPVELTVEPTPAEEPAPPIQPAPMAPDAGSGEI